MIDLLSHAMHTSHQASMLAESGEEWLPRLDIDSDLQQLRDWAVPSVSGRFKAMKPGKV